MDSVPIRPALVSESLAQFGFEFRHVLRNAMIPESLIFAEKTYITTRQFFDSAKALESMGATPDLGLRMGSDLNSDPFNVSIMAALHSRNFGDALTRLSRYKRLTCPEDLLFERADREIRIEFRWVFSRDPIPRFLVDGSFSTILALFERGTTKKLMPLRVELARRKNTNKSILQSHFGCEVALNRARNLLVIDEYALAEKFSTHDQSLLDILLPGLELALSKMAVCSPGSWSLRTEQAVVRRMRGQRPTIEDVACDLRVGCRTLQRRLADEGATYQQLLDSARKNVAYELLISTDMEFGEISFALGFEELNSFSRAFRSWYGMTPARWRALHSADATRSIKKDNKTPCESEFRTTSEATLIALSEAHG